MNQRSPHQVVLAHIARGPAFLARGLIQLYRHTLSALIGLECRHLPTCSSYADEAIGRFGLWAGGWMTLARLCRCHPFGTSGLDFVASSLPVREVPDASALAEIGIADPDAENHASLRAFEKAGFRHVRDVEEEMDGVGVPHRLMRLDRETLEA